MRDEDFNDFVDSLIVAAADRQTGSVRQWLDYADLCDEFSNRVPPTWRDMAADRIQKLGYGRFTIDADRPGGRVFKINADGISHAAEVRFKRRIPTMWERIRKLSLTTWVALATFVVGVLSLFIGL